MVVNIPCRGARYYKLWYDENKWRQLDNNIKLYIHAEGVWHRIKIIPRVEDTIIQCYRSIMNFTMGAHHIYIQP